MSRSQISTISSASWNSPNPSEASTETVSFEAHCRGAPNRQGLDDTKWSLNTASTGIVRTVHWLLDVGVGAAALALAFALVFVSLLA